MRCPTPALLLFALLVSALLLVARQSRSQPSARAT